MITTRLSAGLALRTARPAEIAKSALLQPALLLLMLCLLLAAVPGAWLALRFESQALQQGQWWRLFTAHLVHLNVMHLMLDLAGLLLLQVILFARMPLRLQWMVVLVSAAVIPLALTRLEPGLGSYAGSSGVLHAMWAAAALYPLLSKRPSDPALPLIALLLLCAKLLLAACTARLAWSVSMEGWVVHQAHAVGAACGALAALAMLALVGPVSTDEA